MTLLSLTVLLIFTVAVFWTDVRYRRIPVWITLVGTLLGLALGAVRGDPGGALLGLLFSLGVTLPLWLMGGMGGGDVKAAAALGAFLGWFPMFWVLLMGSLAGLIWGLAQKGGWWRVTFLARQTAIAAVIRRPAILAGAVRRLPPDPTSIPDYPTVPFGACLALGVWAWWLVIYPTAKAGGLW